MYKEAAHCRICGNAALVSIVNLGEQALTGVFPRSTTQAITTGPLELVKCHGENACGLVQLRQSYDLHEMYGMNYGYRSGLNRSMVAHLHELVGRVRSLVSLGAGDLVLDIGSNDGTLLGAYPSGGPTLTGIDPSGPKFRQYYREDIDLIPEFFSAAAVRAKFGARKAKVISSIAMFYDLEAPQDFVREIADTLADDGIWLFEQSYMPTMLDVNAYDTICHEHLEYYGLAQIKWMTDRAGLKIVDVWLNDTNGGSFAVMAAKQSAPYPEATERIEQILADERARGLHTLAPYEQFKAQIFEHRDHLLAFLAEAKRANKKILGYGASTKGNVILQFCKLTAADIPAIAEVNEDKFGAFTPGTHIPIISERDARAQKPDYFLVLPWHFRPTIIEREQSFMQSGGKLLFPLPRIEAYPGA
jgi:NDP-4-keto-2,6-dideoxyhexose 3-C-methyltransferase